MSVIQVQLPDELKSLSDRQVAEGRIASASEFFAEASRRLSLAHDRMLLGPAARRAKREAGG